MSENIAENIGENGQNLPLKILPGKVIEGTLPPFAKRPIKTIEDAKHMLGKMIHGFQLGRIDSLSAKTLTYMIVSFVEIIRNAEFEGRIKRLEEERK
jgi:hypothetical protein